MFKARAIIYPWLSGEVSEGGEKPALHQQPYGRGQGTQQTQGNDERPARRGRVNDLRRPGRSARCRGTFGDLFRHAATLGQRMLTKAL